MAILVMILKVIGIVLLCLTGLLLLALGLILFVPVRVQAEGTTCTDKRQYRGFLCVKFLGFLFRYRTEISNDGDAASELRIFGFKKKRKEPAEDMVSEVEEAAVKETDAIAGERENTAGSGPAEEKTEGAEPGKESKNKHRAEPETNKKKRAFKDIIDRGKKINKTVRDIFNDDNKYAIKKIWQELAELLRHVRLKLAEGNVIFSVGDPADTGIVLGAISVFPFVYQKKLSIQPDFERDTFYVDGNIKIKGSLRLYFLLRAVCRLVLDKKLRRTYQKLNHK